ncbi:MAG: anti-sigma factor family protein [bacterium]
MNKELEKLDALIAGVQKRKPSLRTPALPDRNCIPEEMLEDYLDHRSPPVQREEVEAHLADCSVCFDRMMILRAMRSEEQVPLPQRLLDRVRDLVPETRPNCLELVLGFAIETIHIIRHTGIILSPAPMLEPVRGEGQTEVRGKTDYVEVKKPFGNITVNVQVERVNGSYKLMVNTLDTKTDSAPVNMRLILSSLSRELNSVDDSEAVFYIKLKQYVIKIIHEGQEIGTVSLDLRKED